MDGDMMTEERATITDWPVIEVPFLPPGYAVHHDTVSGYSAIWDGFAHVAFKGDLTPEIMAVAIVNLEGAREERVRLAMKELPA